MNDIGGSSGIRNGTILMILAGAFNIYFGYTFLQFSTIFPGPFQPIIGILMIVFGVLTLCTSLIVWLQNPWATKLIAGVGIATCGTLIIFGYYTLTIILLVPIYWVAIDQFRRGIVHSDWHED